MVVSSSSSSSSSSKGLYIGTDMVGQLVSTVHGSGSDAGSSGSSSSSRSE